MNSSYSPIKTLIFDLGGVIINIHEQNTLDAFAQLGLQQPREIFTIEQQSALCHAFETGRLSIEDFISQIANRADAKVAMPAIRQAWNALIADIPVERIQLLQQLRKEYRLILLSNINPIHHETCLQRLQGQHDIDDFQELFDSCYYSYQVGLRKPDREIFEKVLTDHHLLPQETCFIDDVPENIATANQLNFKTMLAPRNEVTSSWFKDKFDITSSLP